MRKLCRRKERRSSVGEMAQNSTAVLEAHIPELRRFARGLLRGDQDRADDLVQDSLERALSHWHQRRSDGNLRNWLYTILYNRFVSEQKRQKRRIWKSIFTEIVEEDLPRIEGGQDGVLAYRDLLRGFSELAEEQRSVLFLVAVEDFTYAETASILGVPIGTVMSRLSRGRERLREYMSGDQPHLGHGNATSINGDFLSRPSLCSSPPSARGRCIGSIESEWNAPLVFADPAYPD